MDSTTLKTGRAPGVRPPPRTFLVVQHGDGARVVPVDSAAPLVIGRSEDADLTVHDPSLSRRHAELRLEAGELVVRDLGSRNGTRVRGERVDEASVRAGEVISIGDTIVCLHRTEGDLPQASDDGDALLTILAHECARSRWLGRALAVIILRSIDTDAPAGRFLPAVQAMLRPLDRVSVDGRHSLLLVVPEHADPPALAREIVAAAGKLGATLACGIATLPGSGSTSHELVAAARTAAERAGGGEIALSVETGETNASGTPIIASARMEELMASARRVAAHAVPVLVAGETGTGKEVLARRIHALSPRAAGPFRAINCAAIPGTLLESTLFGHEKGAFTGADRARPGIFQLADRGTLFLDEVGELSPAAQASLLRTLETGRLTRVGGIDEIDVDVRIVAATHRDLEQMCERGEFRWDLLYRLNTVVLDIPPLRERVEEIEPLAQRFLDEARARAPDGPSSIAEDALEALRTYRWPGNVRELRNVIERAMVLATSDRIRPVDLPPRVRERAIETAEADPEGGDLRAKLAGYEQRLILEALEATGGNQSEAARRLGLPRRTFSSKLAQYGIKKRYE